MNYEEAVLLLEHELDKFRTESYADLVRRIPAASLDYETVGRSGTRYQVEVQFFWDDRREGNIRVTGSIDDGGWRAFVPLSRDFIKTPDGSLVGE